MMAKISSKGLVSLSERTFQAEFSWCIYHDDLSVCTQRICAYFMSKEGGHCVSVGIGVDLRVPGNVCVCVFWCACMHAPVRAHEREHECLPSKK